MEMELVAVERNQPRSTKNAVRAEELSFFLSLRNRLIDAEKRYYNLDVDRIESVDSPICKLHDMSYLDTNMIIPSNSTIRRQRRFAERQIKRLRKSISSAEIKAAETSIPELATKISSIPEHGEQSFSKDSDDDAEANPLDHADSVHEEEYDVSCAKSAMKELVPMIDPKLKLEIKSDPVMDAHPGTNQASRFKSEKLAVETRGTPTNIIPELEEDDLIIPSFIMPDDDDYYADGAVDEMDRGKPDAQLAIEKDEMAYMESNITQYRSYWETIWGKTCSSFSDITTLSSMQFTHLTPEGTSRYDVRTETTLQIFTIKLTEIKGGFRWPLSVYGLVAARDHVDGNRNLLFFCDSTKPQELSKDDPFLRLIGPSRAIVLTDPVDFEIQLKVKRSAKPDRTLITDIWHYTERCPGVSTFSFKNCFCTAEVCLEQVKRSVQATILGVRVVKCGSWPSEHGCRVAAYPSTRKDVSSDIDGITNHANPSSGLILLLDSKDGKLTKSSDGYLNLSRQVVSVQLAGKLEVVVESYLPSGVIAERGLVCFKAKDSQISQDNCLLGDAVIEITVAWSLLVEEKQDIAAPDFLDGF